MIKQKSALEKITLVITVIEKVIAGTLTSDNGEEKTVSELIILLITIIKKVSISTFDTDFDSAVTTITSDIKVSALSEEETTIFTEIG